MSVELATQGTTCIALIAMVVGMMAVRALADEFLQRFRTGERPPLLRAFTVRVVDGASARGWLALGAGIAGGEFYRLLTGHFVHLGPLHLILNIAGLVLVWFLVGRFVSTIGWFVAVGLSLVSINLGLLLGLPTLDWYVGLSGLLHGLLATGLVVSWHRRQPELIALAAILFGKLGWEFFVGPIPGSSGLSGGAVVTESHLFGAIGGTVAGLLYRLYNAPPSQEQRTSEQ